MFSNIDRFSYGEALTWAFAYISAPFFALVQLILLVAMVICLFVTPAKVEAKGILIAGIVFGGLVFLSGILILLSGSIMSDPVRAERFSQLLGGGAGLCFFFSAMSAMAYHSKLLGFLNMKLEASQPITNTMFYFLYLAVMFVIYFATPYACYYLMNLVGWLLLLAIDAVVAIAIRQLIAQAKMFFRSKQAINKYILEA
jgi:hypothetical protein